MISWCNRGNGRCFILLFVAIFVIATYEIAGATQPLPTILWYVTLDGGDFGSVAVGPDGNPVVAGQSGGSFHTVKRDGNTGALLWSALFPNGINLGAPSVAIGPDGNPVVTGTTGGGDAGPQDFLTIKYNGTTGEILWTATFDALDVDRAMGVAIGPDGHPVVTGISCGPSFNSPSCDFRTIKYDGSSGTILWNVTYDSGGQDFARGVTVASDGDVFVVGASNFVDVVTIKYDGGGNGTLIWTATYNNTTFGTGEEQGWGIAVGLDGNPVVTGNSRVGSNQNVRTVKLDGSTGAILWNTVFDSGAGEEAKGVAVGLDGNPVVTGSVNPTGGVDADNFLTIKHHGSTGAILWNVTFDTEGKDVASGVAVGPDGNPVVTGTTRQSAFSGFDFLTIKYLQQLTVSIDIKPGSDSNSINLSSAGVIPVAILGSATFDATQVDPATVTLAGASVKLIGKGTKYSCSTEDVNADGFVDLVCHVVTAQFMVEPGASVALLEAQTFGGQAIRGEDSINVVPD